MSSLIIYDLEDPGLNKINMNNITKLTLSLETTGYFPNDKYRVKGLFEFPYRYRNLEELEVFGRCFFSHRFNPGILHFSKLKKMFLRDVTFSKMESFWNLCPNLEELDITNCYSIQTIGEINILHNLKCLRMAGSGVASHYAGRDLPKKFSHIPLILR